VDSLPDPLWIARPNAQSFARYYPRDALESEIDGQAVLDCLVLEGGVLNCRVAHEAPAERGFGVAALMIAQDFRVERSVDGTPALGRRVRVPIRFNVG
jgi:TonB family protein